jgi:hypothetical protein
LKLAAAALIAAGGNAGHAEITQVYTFEGETDGFGPNGLDVDVTSDTIGATQGTGSLKLDIGKDATFVGALTTLLPPEIGDPPGLDFVVFDVTIPTAFPEAGFVNAGITVFGYTQPDYPTGQQFGLQAQFILNEFALGDLAPGTYQVRMNLTGGIHPLTNQITTFDNIFGTVGSGVNDLIPSGFEIYINKSTQAPWVGYIDNIRVGQLDANFNNDGKVDGSDLTIWKMNFGASNANGDADFNGVTDGADFLVWQRQLGSMMPAAGQAAPEPCGGSLIAIALAGAALVRRKVIRL